ncbi:TetR/AcrR family transcriptional regulator [Glycocaulis abyssi]|uniref:TetR/AcrR family transcriptional regulator n=1 Tax=Glycocaulis abyssi TaxID=1433403 RepID=A0ABV9NFJ4_9PROT
MSTQDPANKTVSARIPRGEARTRLLDTALKLIRQHGFAGTSVDALCKEAGVTKGAFFHHFESKEALGVAAADYWSETTSALFASAPYHAPEDPLERVYAYLDFRAGLVEGEIPEFTCLVGTMVQETYDLSTPIREACHASIAGHAATLEADIQAALDARGLGAPYNASSLALLTQTVLQGGFITSKAQGGPEPVLDAIAHLKRYFTFIFEGEAAHERSAA